MECSRCYTDAKIGVFVVENKPVCSGCYLGSKNLIFKAKEVK